MTPNSRPITADELWKMPSDHLYELVNGELRTIGPAGFDHGIVNWNILHILTSHIRQKPSGAVIPAGYGFILRHDPDTVTRPDVAFLAQHRIPSGPLTTKFYPYGPDLAVEVVSPNDKLIDVEEKVDEYIAAGTQLVLIASPRRRTITVHRPAANPAVLRDDEILDASPVLPDLKFTVRDAFA